VVQKPTAGNQKGTVGMAAIPDGRDRLQGL
jgi:hypothetical protein